ncbi:hypothetical protein GGR50DRAFT_648937 [Xylaria sp. CBS 124048]|nr:hypothetical protein GGR50DRAFT_648937 [Xylaria sp. CBS 124048]
MQRRGFGYKNGRWGGASNRGVFYCNLCYFDFSAFTRREGALHLLTLLTTGLSIGFFFSYMAWVLAKRGIHFVSDQENSFLSRGAGGTLLSILKGVFLLDAWLGLLVHPPSYLIISQYINQSINQSHLLT